MSTMSYDNDHNVYILGAGFSTTAGLPTMAAFLHRMRDALDVLSDPVELSAVNEVLKFRLEAAAAAYWTQLDLENVEQLFSLASAARAQVSEVIPTALAATLEFARKSGPDGRVQTVYCDTSRDAKLPTSRLVGQLNQFTCEGRTTFHVASLLGMFNPQSQPSGNNTFITFNYDTLVEDALARLEVPWTYKFQENRLNFRDNNWGRTTVNPAVPVLKLHGSVNWGHVQGAKQIDARLTVFRSYAELRAAGATPRLIPPTWNKGLEDQLAQVWTNALNALSTATRIIIIGFSMPDTDTHFRYLLAAGLKANASLRSIIFVNNDAEGIRKRAESVFGGKHFERNLVRIVPSYIDAFISAVCSGQGQPESTGATEKDLIRRMGDPNHRVWVSSIEKPKPDS